MVLDPLFIIVFHFGIAGAAWATAISQIIAFLMGLLYFFKPNCRLKIIKIYGGWIYILKAAFNGFSEFLSTVQTFSSKLPYTKKAPEQPRDFHRL